MDWYTKVLKNYVGFSGRARRTEYWMFTLVNVIIGGVLNVLYNVTGSSIFYVLYVLYFLAVLLPSIAVGIRRLHDTNRTGWWLLIGLVPFIGAIVLIVFFVMEGNRGANQYGADPKGIESGAAPATA